MELGLGQHLFNKDQKEMGRACSGGGGRVGVGGQHSGLWLLLSTPLETGEGPPITVTLWPRCHCPKGATWASGEAERHSRAYSSNSRVRPGNRNNTEICHLTLGIHGSVSCSLDTPGKPRQ